MLRGCCSNATTRWRAWTRCWPTSRRRAGPGRRARRRGRDRQERGAARVPERRRTTRVLAGACDALATPRPLGAFADVAEATGRRGRGAAGHRRGEPVAVATALADALDAAGRPAARGPALGRRRTFDVLRLLARRLAGTAALVVLTFRDDEVGRDHPLRVALGELPAGVVVHLPLAPLSPAAVAQLADAAAPTPTACTRARAATRSSSPRRWRRPARRCRRRSATPSWPGPRASTPGRARRSTRSRSSPTAPSSGWSRRRSRTAARRRSSGRWPRACWSPTARACASATRSRARRSRRRSRRRGASSCTAARCERSRTPSRSTDPARLAVHAEAADDARRHRRATRPPPGTARPRCPPIARRPASTPARCATSTTPTRGATSCSSAARRACWLIDDVDDAIAARRELLARAAAGDRRDEAEQHRWLARLNWLAGDHDAAEARPARGRVARGRARRRRAAGARAERRLLAADGRLPQRRGGRARRAGDRAGRGAARATCSPTRATTSASRACAAATKAGMSI